MFTGIVQQVGQVRSLEPTETGVRVTIDPGGWDHSPRPGESIANNGCCLTLVTPVEEAGGMLVFDAIPETISRTTIGGWTPGTRVNIERALRMGDTLDGHQVQGHIDGVGQVTDIETGGGWRMRVGLDQELMRFMVPKGSIAIDGVSLTIAALSADERWVEVALIPETLERTNLRERTVGDRVNIECDVMVKTIVQTVERLRLADLRS